MDNSIVAAIVIDSSFQAGHESLWGGKRRWWALRDFKLKEYGYQNIHSGGGSDPPWFYDSAVVLVDYPLTEEKIWWSNIMPFVSIKYSVLGKETISCANKSFDCDIVGSHAAGGDLNADSSDYRDWYSNEGWIRSVRQDWPIAVYDSNIVIDSIRAISTTELINIELGP